MRSLSFHSRLHIIPLLALTLLISGCQQEDSLDFRYQDYLERVSNVLDLDAPDQPKPEAIAYPDRRSRLIEIPAFDQGVVEVWDFRRCGLMSLINQRNSNLGKVLQPSQRFIYEYRFWQKLEPCYGQRQQWLDEDADFVQRLEATYQHKIKIRPLVVHQLFFAGEELENQLSQSQQAFLPDARPEYKQVAEALSTLATIAENPYGVGVNTETLETHLQNLNRQPILHSLLKSLQVSTLRLNQVADILENRLDQRPVCLQGASTPKAKILFNVLQKYYLQAIQPVIAHHSRMANQLLPPSNRIFSAAESGTTLATYQQRWLSQQDDQGLWQRFQNANRRHTEVWNRLLRQCGLFPNR